MEQDHVIYTDGRDVTVTDTTLRIRNHAYKINGIVRSTLRTIRPERWPAILLALLGAGLAVCGWMALFPSTVYLGEMSTNGNLIAIWVGVSFLIVGILALAISREKYAVRIVTAEGEKDALVSKKREYVAQIVNALDRAFSFNRPPGFAGDPLGGPDYARGN